MSDIPMTTGARHILRSVRTDCLNNFLVTVAAGVLSDAPVARLDFYRSGIVACRERERMPEAVVRFYRVFSNDVVRRMAIIAGGDGAVAGFDPCVVMILHHMAVCARSRIVSEVRISFGVDESVATDP